MKSFLALGRFGQMFAAVTARGATGAHHAKPNREFRTTDPAGNFANRKPLQLIPQQTPVLRLAGTQHARQIHRIRIQTRGCGKFKKWLLPAQSSGGATVQI